MKIGYLSGLLLAVAACTAVPAEPLYYDLISPDGRLDVKIEVDSNISMSMFDGKDCIVSVPDMSVTLDDGSLWGKATGGSMLPLKDVRSRSVSRVVKSPFWWNGTILEEYNQAKLVFDDYGVIIRVYNDGVAYQVYARGGGNPIVPDGNDRFVLHSPNARIAGNGCEWNAAAYGDYADLYLGQMSYLLKDKQHRKAAPGVVAVDSTKTFAARMALPIMNYSAMSLPECDTVAEIPSVFDNSRILDASKDVVVMSRTADDVHYVGAESFAGPYSYVFDFSSVVLPGEECTAMLVRDAGECDTIPERYVVEEFKVTSQTQKRINIADNGGFVIIVR